jgi:flagellar M-ring protein FliF
MIENLKEALGRLGTKQKVQMAMAVLVTVGMVWGISLYATRIRYTVLFSGLSRDDAAPVIEALRESQIPYRLEAGGSIIEVPAERVDEVRLDLAGKNLPSGGGVGFEIFDKPAFGLSDFVQNVNFRRALERELARTIQSLDTVDSARVHLALPPESVFLEDDKEPSASVVVRLRSGGALTSDRVRAITNLVASGVEGLRPGNVSVIDGHGRMLSGSDEEDDGALSATQHEAKRSMERNLERTLLAILEPVVGQGRARARATVELNMTRVQRVQESFDPDGAVVRSEQKSKSKRSAGAPGGAPGTVSNLPGENPPAGGGSASNDETSAATTNFEIGKTVSTINEPMGTMVRQSIAVVVDNAPGGGGEQDGAPAESAPRSDEEMQKITELVRAAAGINAQRGDVLIVQNIPFDHSLTEIPDSGGGFSWGLWLQIARYVSLPVAILLLALLIVRPGIAAVRSLRAGAPAEGGFPPTVAEMQAQLGVAGLPPGSSGGALRQKLIEAVNEDPQTAALIVKDWVEAERG